MSRSRNPSSLTVRQIRNWAKSSYLLSIDSWDAIRSLPSNMHPAEVRTCALLLTDVWASKADAPTNLKQNVLDLYREWAVKAGKQESLDYGDWYYHHLDEANESEKRFVSSLANFKKVC